MKIETTSREDYLKAILVLSRKYNPVRSIDLASYLGFSRPSISRAVSLLESEGYITVQNHGLYLTEKGKKTAEETYDKFCFFAETLISIGVSPKTAKEDACRLEHAISNESFDKIKMNLIKKK